MFCFFYNLSRKISAHEFERGGLLKPIVNTIDGTPTFLSISPQNETAICSIQNQNGLTNSIMGRPQRLSRNELKQLDEKELIFELVKFKNNTTNLIHFINLFCFFSIRSKISAMN